jgi:hypothetical protein
MKERKKLEPLKITCTTSDCDSGLHCFLRSRTMSPNQVGNCRACGIDLIDWDRVHKRDLSDARWVSQQLEKEFIRHHFWHRPIDARAEYHARRKGRSGMKAAVKKRLATSIGIAEPAYDGRQTPMDGNIIYYAQHATACCCRKCLEYWHNMEKGKELSHKQLAYLEELVQLYIDKRMPKLTVDGERLPGSLRRFEEAGLRWPSL